MADVLFNITCTTCEARLNVRDSATIGAIVNCPKCGGMVQIVPPPGWQAPTLKPPQREEPAGSKQPAAPDKPTTRPGRRVTKPGAGHAKEAVPKESAAKPSVASSTSNAAKVDRQKAEKPEESTSTPLPKKQKRPGKQAAEATVGSAALGAAAASAAEPPPAPPVFSGASELQTPPALVEGEAPPVQTPAEMVPLESAPTTPIAPWGNPAEAAMRRWLLWGALPVAGAVMLIGAWTLFSGGDAPAHTNDDPQTPIASIPDDRASQVPLTPIADFDDRWVPNSPQFVLSLDVAGSEAAGQLGSLLKTVPTLNEAVVAGVFQGFGLKPAAVERLCWSSADLVDWAGTGVIVIKLAEGQSTSTLRSTGVAIEKRVDGIEIRQLDRPTWRRAFAVLDDRTIVTGEEGLLRKLAERGDTPADLGLLQRLLVAAPANVDFFFAVNLQAASKAGWPLPTDWLDVWPQGRDAWEMIWRLPAALSLSFDREELALAELGLLCDGETVADKVRVALEQWIPQAKSVLTTRISNLSASVQAGEISADSSGPYRLALKGAADALASSHLDVDGPCVWLRADCGANSAAWTAAAAESRAAMRGDWYRAAGQVDKTLQAQLHGALTGYSSAERKAPPGAVNSGALPPEQVLSWITAILPYLGHAPWAEDIHPSYSWDSRKNRPVTMRALDAVQNPAVPMRETASGFPVTHYVGMAGVGPDAANLPRDDPRAGIFGYRESRRLTDVPDGASNTIATIGVSEKLGPWASGGAATVRGFTQKPYINGPDGFGSGMPGGMVVGMADSSSRFLAADIDPTVLEQLATAAGGESVPLTKPPAEQVARVEPQPSSPENVPGPKESPIPTHGDEAPTDKPPASQPAEHVAPITERLLLPLPGISMTNTPLQQAVRAIENYGSLLVTYDLDTMSTMGVSLDQPVSEQELGVTVGKALDVVLASCGLKAVVRDNQLWVTGAAQASETPRTVPYTVADLTAANATATTEFASWIPRLIAPETWQSRGGPGEIRVKDDVLEVTQSGTVQWEILVFCERLRVARGLAPRSGRPAGQFPLATRCTRAAALLQQPVSANFFRPTALQRVLREITAQCDVLIGANWLTLAKEGKTPDLPTQLSVAQVPLGKALGQMLDPLDLDFRVIDERTVEVTTRAAADAHFEREFYPVRSLLDAGESASSLTERVLAQVDAKTWQANGGQGAVQFDEPSGCLIVLQTQRGHVAIERYLQSLRDAQKTAPK